jgi:alpha-ketoglutarate-dependent taurine dioxygenase
VAITGSTVIGVMMMLYATMTLRGATVIAEVTCAGRVDADTLAADVRSGLQGGGVVIVRGFPDAPGCSLADLGGRLGTISSSAVTAPGVHDVYEHPVRQLAEPLLDRHGMAILSTTNAEFPCHTDDYFSDRPADIVMLLCVRPASVGGDSVFAHIDDVVGELPAAAAEVLRRPVFPVPFGSVAVLAQDEAGVRVRYNRVDIQRECERRSGALAADVEGALDEFDRVVRSTERQRALAAGDCVIIDNARVLHGRTAFPNGDDRLLRRMKVHV